MFSKMECGKMECGRPLFENIFGENNTIKVLDFLFMGKEFDFTLTHISNGTELSRTAVRNAINELLSKDMVIESREDQKSKYYKINKKENKFKILESLYKKLQTEVIAA